MARRAIDQRSIEDRIGDRKDQLDKLDARIGTLMARRAALETDLAALHAELRDAWQGGR